MRKTQKKGGYKAFIEMPVKEHKCLNPELPECIAIDEFRGNAGGEKFQCNFADPVKHKIIDILPSRNVEALCEIHMRKELK